MTLYPRITETEISGIEIPHNLKNTTSELALSAMQILGEGVFPSAITHLTPAQRSELLEKLKETPANGNRPPVAAAA